MATLKHSNIKKLFVSIWPNLALFGCNFKFSMSYRYPLLTITMASTTCNVSNMCDAPEVEDSSFLVPNVACFMVHTLSQGNKEKTTKKGMKTKEFSHIFCATKVNYLKFLTTILTKHHINNKIQVTDCRCYSCKMQVSPLT